MGILWKKIGMWAVVAGVAWLLRDGVAYAGGILLGGILIAALISPLQKRLEKYMGGGLALACAWLIVLAAAGAVLFMLVPVVISQAQAICRAWPEFCRMLSENITLPDPMDWAGLAEKLMGVFGRITSGVSVAAGAFTRLGMMLLVSVFLLCGKEKYLLMAELIIPYRYRRRSLRVGRRILRELKLFLVGQGVVSLCVGALTAVGLMLIGMNGALLMGVITAIFNLIPYFGPVLAAIPVILLAWMDGWGQAALASAVLIIVQQIDGFFISPKVMSGATGLSPLSVLLALAAGGAAFGTLGMALAIPGAIIGRIFISEWMQNRGIYRN